MAVSNVRRPRALWEDSTVFGQIALALPVSVVVHLLILAAIGIPALFKKKDLPPPRYEVMLVGPIKKGTPGGGASAKATAPDLTKPKNDTGEMVVPVSTPKPANGAIPDPDESREEVLARLKREQALKRAQELAAANAKAGNSANPIPVASTPPAANGSGEGTGDGGSEYGVEWSTLTGSASYEQQIQAIVTELWIPSLGSDKKQLQCIVRVVIGFDGKVMKTTMEAPSEDAAFNSSVLATFRKLPDGKFPPPPIDLKSYLANRGVPLRFDSRTKKLAGP